MEQLTIAECRALIFAANSLMYNPKLSSMEVQNFEIIISNLRNRLQENEPSTDSSSKRSIYARTTMEAMPGSCTECEFGQRYGCVGDVKCRILNEYFTGNVEPPYKERPDACPLLEVRNEADTITPPPNAPLTPEELRGMDGESVWWEDKYGDKGYGTISIEEYGTIIYVVPAKRTPFVAVVRGEKNGQLGLKIYRRKPEGV